MGSEQVDAAYVGRVMQETAGVKVEVMNQS